MSEVFTEKVHGSARVGDVELAYFEVGSGHPVLLLHGSGPGANAWGNFAPNVAALARHFRVIGVDLPGWGRSSPVIPGETDQVANIVGLIEALELESVALIGNSLGAATALGVAVKLRERISAVITMGMHSGAPAMFSPGGPSEGIKTLLGAYRDPSPEGMKRLVSVMTYAPESIDADVIQTRSEEALSQPAHLENFLESFRRGHYLRPPATLDELEQIDVPILLIHGRDDRVLSYEHSLAALPRLKNAQLLLVNRCGHWAQLEHAEEFNRHAVSFLLSVCPSHESVTQNDPKDI